MNTKDTTEVAGKFTRWVLRLGTALFCCGLALLSFLVAVFPSALDYIWPLTKLFLWFPLENSHHLKIFLPKKLLECLPRCPLLPPERLRWNTNEVSRELGGLGPTNPRGLEEVECCLWTHCLSTSLGLLEIIGLRRLGPYGCPFLFGIIHPYKTTA